MPKEIFDAACLVVRSEDETERGYREFKKSRDLSDKAKAALTAVLIEKAVYEPVAIVMGGNKTLVCAWNGANGYEFSLIRSFS